MLPVYFWSENKKSFNILTMFSLILLITFFNKTEKKKNLGPLDASITVGSVKAGL
jgi:hypothetical protein